MKFTINLGFCSSRSQSAFTTSGGFLHIFGGYSRNLSQNWAMSAMQSVGLHHTREEQEIHLDSESDTNRFAAAVTLKSGVVILTGGKNRPKEVFHLSHQNWKSKRLADMENGRYGHASVVFYFESDENVIVAGGCNGQGEIQLSVEMYSMNKNIWTNVQNLPTARIYFTLQVDNTKRTIKQYNQSFQVEETTVCAVGGYNTGTARKKEFPGNACITWNQEGWSDWTENKSDEERSSFMSTLVPMSWIEGQCATVN